MRLGDRPLSGAEQCFGLGCWKLPLGGVSSPAQCTQLQFFQSESMFTGASLIFLLNLHTRERVGVRTDCWLFCYLAHAEAALAQGSMGSWVQWKREQLCEYGEVCKAVE